MQEVKYDPDFINALGDDFDLLEYANATGYDFTKKGREFVCHCPRHIDKTPSLTISEDDYSKFWCFSCGAGGRVLKWLMQIEGLRFDEAVEKAAKLQHIDISKAQGPSPVISYMKQVARARKYMAVEPERKPIDESIMNDFEYGDIPLWRKEGIKQEVMDTFEVGIDPSTNRIVYPVRNVYGDLLNIKARTMYPNYKEMGFPKYINLFPIGALSYFEGLNVTYSDVKQAGEIILFESIKSTMKCYGWGIKNTAAVGNHGLADLQLKALIGMKVDVVIAYDKDVIIANDPGLRKQLRKLARFTNVYIIQDYNDLLGAKDSPADKTQEIFQVLYDERKRF